VAPGAVELNLNLLFLPLLGGYIFYSKWHATKFYAARCTGERILFHAAAFGLLFLVLARVFVMATPEAASHQTELVPIAFYLVISSLLALLFGLCWVVVDARGSETRKDELGTHQPAAGLLIAAVVIAPLGLLLRDVFGPEWMSRAAAIVIGTSCVGGAIFLATHFLRADIRSLETSLYEQSERPQYFCVSRCS